MRGDGPGGVIPERGGSLTVNIRSESDQIADELSSKVDGGAVRAVVAANGAEAGLKREKQMPAPTL